jgi:hypothetical protein
LIEAWACKAPKRLVNKYFADQRSQAPPAE